MSAVDGVLALCSVSLPVLEQEELSVCVIKKSAIAWPKEIGINWFPRQTPVSEHVNTAVLHYAKHSQVQKILRHLPP